MIITIQWVIVLVSNAISIAASYFPIYCRIGIYRATKISRKADFLDFRVYFISRASEFYSATYWIKQ